MSALLWLLRSAVLLAGVLLAERLAPTARVRRLLLIAGLAGALLLPMAAELATPWLSVPVPEASVAEWAAPPQAPELAAPEAPAAAPASTPTRRAAAPSLLTLALSVWAAGAALLLLRALGGRLWLARVVARARPVDAPGEGPPVWLTSALEGPGFTGPWPRAILVPEAWEGWTPTQRLHVLRHERAHAAAGDDWARLLAQLAGALLWPDPLVHVVARRLRLSSELLADQRVLGEGVGPVDYVETLAALARVRQRERAALVAMSGRSALTERVRQLLFGAPPRAPRSRTAAACGLALLTLVAACVSQADPEAAPVEVPLASEPGLHRTLQEAAAAELEVIDLTWNPDAVAIVAVDPATGQVVAEAGAATQQPMVLGSVLKPFTVAAALREGVDPDAPLPGHDGAWSYGGLELRDHRAFERLTTRELLVASSNIGAVELLDRVGPEAVARAHADFGLGEPPPVEPGSADAARLAMGLATAVTPTQLAQAYAVLIDQAGPSPRTGRVLAAEDAEEVLASLSDAVGPEGTGHRAWVPDHEVFGKTGTSLTEEGGAIASFAGGWTSADAPMALVVVVVNPQGEGAYGGAVAAPAFARVLQATE